MIWVLLAASCLGSVSVATAFDEDVVPFSDRFPVEISIPDHAHVYQLQKFDLDIDAAGDGWVRAYIDRDQMEMLEHLGYPVRRIPNQALRMWRSIKELEQPVVMDVYHDYDAVTTYLEGVAADHPTITSLVSIGKSVQERNLWFIKITDNPGIEEDEPEFKYIATMHGDEPVGTENCLKFIDLLTDNYDSAGPDEQLKRLVDEVEIWIMPMMNPDGNSAGSRYNANGADLNRSFPDWVDDPDNTPVGREPEVQAVMVFSNSMSFDLSANFHGGSLVVNYPWDNRPARTPDDSLFISMSEAYSIHNVPMWNSPTFYHGITNGYDWYEVHGGMQDWNYDWMHNMEVTIELDDVKWPPASRLPELWDDNDEAMTAYLEYCLRGVRGVVTDSVSGEPLHAAVHVEGNAWDDRTDPDVGDYHRILDPDTYVLTFSHPGYISKQVADVVVTSDSATVLDVELVMAPLVSVSGTVTSELLTPLEAKVEFRFHTGGELADSTTTDPADGSYGLVLPVGEYDIGIRSDGYVPEFQFADVQGDTTFDFELRSTSGAILIVSDGTGAGAELADDLVLIGYEVMEESAATTDPMTWPDYELLVWSSGGNTSPVTSSSYRRNLLDYAAEGCKLLIEGGELAYDAVVSPGYPDFADSVLHTNDWNGDNVGSLDIVAGQSGHSIANLPNTLPGTIEVTYSGYGSEDATHPSGGAYIVYGTSLYPSDAGVLVYDGGVGGNQAQIVFFAFAYSDLTHRGLAKELLENVATYLIDEAASAESPDITPSRSWLAGACPNPFSVSTRIGFAVPRSQRIHLAVYDVRGRLVDTLVDDLVHTGVYSARWEGTDTGGSRIAPGTYFLRFSTSETSQTRKIVKIR